MASEARDNTGLLNASTRKRANDARLRSAILGIAILASLALLYWQVQNPLLLLAFLVLAGTTGAIIYFLRPNTQTSEEGHASFTDWTVTLSLIHI